MKVRADRAKLWLAVAGGGAVGTLLRYVIDELWAGNNGLVVMIINVVGSFALGYLVTTVFVRPGLPTWLAPAVGPGLLGGFTTMSGFALWVNRTALDGTLWLTAVLLFGNIVLGLVAAWAGLLIGRRRTHKPLPRITAPEWAEES